MTKYYTCLLLREKVGPPYKYLQIFQKKKKETCNGSEQ